VCGWAGAEEVGVREVKEEYCILRELPRFEAYGRVTPEVKFTPEFRDKHEGVRVPVTMEGRKVFSGVLRFRGSELWLTDLAPVELPDIAANLRDPRLS